MAYGRRQAVLNGLMLTGDTGKTDMLDKLYYIFHCSIKRGFAHAERASFMLSFSAVAYLGALCFLVIHFANIRLANPLLSCAIFGLFGIGIIYLTSLYFVQSGRYRKIIAIHGSPAALSKRRILAYRLISFGIFFGSFVAFAVSGKNI